MYIYDSIVLNENVNNLCESFIEKNKKDPEIAIIKNIYEIINEKGEQDLNKKIKLYYLFKQNTLLPQALKIGRDIYIKYPNNSNIYKLLEELAFLEIEERNGENSEKIFLQLIKQNPKNEQFYYGLSHSYLLQNKNSNALKYAQLGLSLKASSYGYMILAMAYGKTKDLNLAIKYLEEAVKLDSKNAKAYFEMAQIYEKQNNIKKASFFYNQALSLGELNMYDIIVSSEKIREFKNE